MAASKYGFDTNPAYRDLWLRYYNQARSNRGSASFAQRSILSPTRSYAAGQADYWVNKQARADAARQQGAALLDTPDFASTSILLAQDKQRRKAQKRTGRQASNVTGGLLGNPTLGAGSLWGV